MADHAAYDSDDSGFGDGLSSDEFIQQRIAQMRDLMRLSSQEPTPQDKATTKDAEDAVVELDDGDSDEGEVSLDEEDNLVLLEGLDSMLDGTRRSSLQNTEVDIPEEREVEDDSYNYIDEEDIEFTADEAGDEPTPHLEDKEEEEETQTGDDDDEEDVEELPVRKSERRSERRSERKSERKSERLSHSLQGFDEDDELSDDDEDEGYTVTWAKGQLGLLFKVGAKGSTVIRRVNKKVGNADGLHYARAGDVLVAINGESVAGTPFADIVERLRAPVFPVTLDFQPITTDDDDDIQASSRTDVSQDDLKTNPKERSAGDSYSSSDANPASESTATAYTQDESEAEFEYEVVWRQGALGCGLKHRNGLPMVKSVTPGAATDRSIAQIAPGDLMITINGLRTEALGFKGVVETLQRAPKPVYMRFRRGAEMPLQQPKPVAAPGTRPVENLRDTRFEENAEVPLGPRQFTVLWKDGPLGVQIKGRSSDGAVVISKFTGTGSPALCNQMNIGDVFVRIAGVDVASIGISGAFELLRTVQKPVVLVFERTEAVRSYVAPPVPPPAPVMAPRSQPRESAAPAKPRESTVPSFRLMRERQEAAATPAHVQIRDSFNNYTAEQRREYLANAAAGGNRRQTTSRSPSREYDNDESGSQHSSHHDKDMMTSSRFVENDQQGDRTYDTLPRFSDIEAGRIVTTAVTALPPPPAYLDVFTQSGRSRAPLSPRSEGQQNSVSSAVGRDQPPPRLSVSMFMPPPPAYHQVVENRNASSGGPAPSPSPSAARPLDRLRQQYIQAERMRNQYPDTNHTVLSTYSDLDDSGVMAARKAAMASPSRSPVAGPSGYGPPKSAPAPGLPPPELWIRWSEGPLGITFRRTDGQIVVSRLTGAGYSAGLDQLCPGDWLISFGNPAVGSYSTASLRLSETMELIKKLPKPVDMCFVVQ